MWHTIVFTIFLFLKLYTNKKQIRFISIDIPFNNFFRYFIDLSFAIFYVNPHYMRLLYWATWSTLYGSNIADQKNMFGLLIIPSYTAYIIILISNVKKRCKHVVLILEINLITYFFEFWISILTVHQTFAKSLLYT